MVERLCGRYAFGDLTDDGFATIGIEGRGGDEAEGVDKLLEERRVLDEIEEEDDGLQFDLNIGHFGAVAGEIGEFGHALHLEDIEGIVDPVHGFEVEEHKAEATIDGAGAPTLAVVLRPVGIAHVEFDGHVIAILVDVEELADLGIGFVGSGIARKVEETLHGFVGATLLDISGIGSDLELVDLVVVETVVGIDVVLVAGLAKVDGTLVDAIDDVPDGLIGLVVDVDGRACNDLLEGNVEDATDGVAAAIAHQYRLMLEIGFFFEERIGKSVLHLVALVGIDAERARCERSAVGADALDTCLLIEEGLTVGREIFDYAGTFPVVVPIAEAEGAMAGTTVDTFDKDADGIVVEVLVGTCEGKDGEVDVEVGFDEGTRDDGAGKITVAEEGKAEGAGLAGREVTCDGYLTIGARGCATVGGIDERAAFGDGDLDVLGAGGEDARLAIDDGRVETIVGERTAQVGTAWGWCCAETVGMAAIGGGSPGATSDGLGIDERDAVVTLGVVEKEGVAVAVELQVNVVGCPDGVVVVEPEHCIAMSRDACSVVDARFARNVGVIAEETARDIDVG